jgi:3-oxoacyl-[acyl-carrier-protein] synthase II
VITGAGLVTPLGIGWPVNADGFRTGRAAFGPVRQFDVARHRAKTAAEVDLPPELPPTRLTPRLVRRLDRASRMLLWAAHEAWQQSGWDAASDLPLVLGTTSGGMSLGEDYYRRAVDPQASRRGQPSRAVHYLAHMQARMLLDAFGFRGPITVIANACASGANALGHAWELLRRGRAQRVLAGGYDALSLLVYSGFDSLQALSPTRCRPFDAARDGLTLGEGAAVLALETQAAAEHRGAAILGELAGYGTAIDLHHLTQPHPQGVAACLAMETACRTAGITAADVDYVNAHGTGTPLNDSSEACAINRWAGERAASLPVSSTKAAIGHLLGAAGAVEGLLCLMAIRERWLPPQLQIGTADPLCRFPIVREATTARVDVALSNSFGFGGANAALAFRRWA